MRGSREGDSEYNLKTSVQLDERHVRFMEEQSKNKSEFIRDLIDRYMEYKQQQDEFTFEK